MRGWHGAKPAGEREGSKEQLTMGENCVYVRHVWRLLMSETYIWLKLQRIVARKRATFEDILIMFLSK